jgi:hypothetical protein
VALGITEIPHLPTRFGDYDGLLVLVTIMVLPVPVIFTGRYGPRGGQPHVEMSRDTPDWYAESGVFGESCRVPTTDRLGRMKLRLLPTALAHTFLELARLLDQLTYVNRVPVAVVDLNSAGLTSGWSSYAYIEGPPALKFGESVAFKEWDLICEQTDMINGSMLKS